MVVSAPIWELLGGRCDGDQSRFLVALCTPIEPVFPKDFNGMLGTHGAIATVEVVGWAILVTAPADTFGILGVQRNLGHVNSWREAFDDCGLTLRSLRGVIASRNDLCHSRRKCVTSSEIPRRPSEACSRRNRRPALRRTGIRGRRRDHSRRNTRKHGGRGGW